MKRKSILGLIISVVLLISLVACGNDSQKEDTQTTETEETTKTVTIVTSGSGLPYSLLDDEMNWTGIDADIWTEIEERTRWEIELKQLAFDSVFGELDTGRADLTANCWAIKEERTEKYYVSIPYYGDAQCIAVNGENTDINTFADLAGKKVGVTTGQASETILQDMAEEYRFELVTYEQSDPGLQEVSLGRIDAMGCAVTTVNNYCDNTGNEMRILDEKLMANNVGYFFPKTDEGKELCEEVDAVLQEMLDDNTLAEITEKWLYEDMTQYIVNE